MIPARPKHADRVYEHAHHAGNVGDVLKHVVLLAALAELGARGPVHWVDTHGGAGRYTLRGAGEWDAGIVRVASARHAPPLVAQLLDACERGPNGAVVGYPGSPLLAAQALGSAGRCRVAEQDAAVAAKLRRALAGLENAEVHDGDGFALLRDAVRSRPRGVRLGALIDPPYALREEWDDAAAAVVDVVRAASDAVVLLWYPIKGTTRPAQVRNAVARGGVNAVAIELVTAALDERKNRLNGSGVLCVNLAPGVLDEVAAAASWLGRTLAVRTGQWSLRILSGTGV